MNKLAAATIILLVSAGSALAATVTNKESSVRVLVVTQGATKNQLVVGSGETVNFCNKGCFVTFPNGDREALTGSETVELSGGRISIK